MSNSFDIQRHLDAQLTRIHHTVADMAQTAEGATPSMSDMVSFKTALMQESAANYTADQLSSLKHSLSKSIIDSIN